MVKRTKYNLDNVFPRKTAFLFSMILLFLLGICWCCALFPSVKIIEPKTDPDYFHYHE